MKAKYYQDGLTPLDVEVRPSEDGTTCDVIIADAVAVTGCPITTEPQVGACVIVGHAVEVEIKPKSKGKTK